MLSNPSNGDDGDVMYAGADFLAGFMFGMTGDNQLNEIEACFNNAEVNYYLVNKGLDEIKFGGWKDLGHLTTAFQWFGQAALQIKYALSTCKGMDEDIAAIEQWAQIFTNDDQLSNTVAKNYDIHRDEIENDIGNLLSD